MPILNALDLKAALVSGLKETGSVSDSYKAWLNDSAFKWLTTKSPKFIDEFTTPVVSNTISSFQQGPGDVALKTYYFVDLSKRRQRLFLEDPYQRLDADRNLLRYFLPKKNVLHWLYTENPIFVHIRDFFDDLLARKPTEDLRKYTLDTLPNQVADWHRQQDAERARRLAEEMRLVAEQARIIDAELATIPHENPKLRQEAFLRASWSSMVRGKDYVVLGEIADQAILQLLSPAALDWEAAYKGSCIDGSSYKLKLRNPNVLLVSTRLKDNLAVPYYTAELVKDTSSGSWELVQFEHWGYLHVTLNSKETISSHFMAIRRGIELQAHLLSEKSKKYVPASTSNLEFVLTHRQTF